MNAKIEKGEFKEAVSNITIILSKAPHWKEIQFKHVECLARTGDFQKVKII